MNELNSIKSTLRTFTMEPTGDYRRPKKGDWFIGFNDWPIQADRNMDYPYYILLVTIGQYDGDKNNV